MYIDFFNIYKPLYCYKNTTRTQTTSSQKTFNTLWKVYISTHQIEKFNKQLLKVVTMLFRVLRVSAKWLKNYFGIFLLSYIMKFCTYLQFATMK